MKDATDAVEVVDLRLCLFLSHLTHKASRVVCCAAALIFGGLRIRAQWSSHLFLVAVLACSFRRDNFPGRFSLFHPTFQRRIYAMCRVVELQLADLTECVRSRTTF